MNLVHELGRIVDAFSAAGIPYALCGGLALAVHGAARATADVDLLVLIDDRDKAIAAAEAAGFDLPAAPMRFQACSIERRTKIDPVSGETLPLDLLLADASSASLLADRSYVPFLGKTLPVVSKASLAALKRLRSSAQDKADLEALGARP